MRQQTTKMADDKKELDGFLSKVDEIESIIKGLTSKNEKADYEDALAHADQFLHTMDNHPKKQKRFPAQDNTGVNRTVINKAAFQDDDAPPGGPQYANGMNPDAFMAVMEQDAQERGERRQKARKEAEIIKEEGNKYFKDGEYTRAVQLYTQALEKVKDLTSIWTNRAQAYIKLQQYENALSDCDWALKVHENCLKAYIHRGRAHLALGHHDDAIEAYKAAMTIDPTKVKVIENYIAEVERARTTAKDEAAARTFLEDGKMEAKGLVELLAMIQKEGQMALYYSGGLSVITNMLNDTHQRVLFRTEGAMNLINTHLYISKCWKASVQSISREELDLLSSMLNLYKAAISNNEENQKVLMSLEGFHDNLVKWLQSCRKGALVVRQAATSLLYVLTESEYGRNLILETMDISKLMSVTHSLMTSEGLVAVHAASIVNNLALSPKVKVRLRGHMDETILPTFENMMVGGAANVLSSYISTLTNLCGDVHIRRQVAARVSTWSACCSVLEKQNGAITAPPGEETVHSLLGLLMNLTVDGSEISAVKDIAARLTSPCVSLAKCEKENIEIRAVGVLSHILPLDGAAVVRACEAGLVPCLVTMLQRQDLLLRKPAMKSLCACTQRHPAAIDQIIQCEQGISTVVGQLKEEEEVIVGNAALCLGHMTSVKKVVVKLVKTNIIQHLLVKARDGQRPAAQHNCAILIAKLSQGDHRHLERLRELHGLEILHDVMKHVKS